MTKWKPLLTGALADRVLGDASRIADDLASLSTPEQLAPSYGNEFPASLATGAAGVALAFGYLGQAGVVPYGAEKSTSLLETSAELMAEVEMGPDLFCGYAGVAWSHAILGSSPDENDDDALSQIDEEVRSLLDGSEFDGPNDLIWGLAGLGVYVLERLPRKASTETLARIVQLLAERAERGADVTWRTSPDHLSPRQRRISPQGHYDLGLAHGVPGIVAFLAQAFAAGLLTEDGTSLLRGAVDGLFAREQAGPSRYPYWITPDGETRAGRSAWCYGDPGVAGALLMVTRCAHDPAWEQHAINLALHAAERSFEDSRVVDATLCHGAAGLGHVFNRAYQRTGLEALSRAATRWFERTLEMCRPGTGYGGYTTALWDEQGNAQSEADPSLLSGAAGIAMALAAAVSPVEPRWDRALLLSSRFET